MMWKASKGNKRHCANSHPFGHFIWYEYLEISIKALYLSFTVFTLYIKDASISRTGFDVNCCIYGKI